MVEQRGHHDGEGGIDQRGHQLGDQHGGNRIHRHRLHPHLEDPGFQHIQGHIGQGPGDAAEEQRRQGGAQGGILMLPLPGPVDHSGDPGHGELADEGDRGVQEIVSAEKHVIQRGTQAGGKAAGHRPQQQARQQAHGVGKVHLGLPQRDPEQRNHADNGSHYGAEDNSR